MKFKKLTAVLLSAATLLSLPRIPLPHNPFAQFEKSISITAEAADDLRGYTVYNGCWYACFFGGTGNYAILLSVGEDVENLVVPRYVSYNNKSYAVQKIAAYAAQNKRKLKTVDLSAATALYEIGDDAFNNSSLHPADRPLTRVKLPNSVTTIGNSAFEGNTNLSSCNMPTQLITMGRLAFADTALSGTITFGARLRNLDPSCFSDVRGIKAYKVNSSNNYYKSVEDVLYYAGATLALYPPQKESTSYTVQSTYISNYAFYYAPNLEILDISKSVYNSTGSDSIWTFPKLSSLTLPDSELKQYSLFELSKRYRRFFTYSLLLKLNGKNIITEVDKKEPVFNSAFRQSVYDHFDEMESYYYYSYYKEKILEYVVNTVTTPNMTDMQKAIRLHNWIVNRVDYDPNEASYWSSLDTNVTTTPADVDMRNHIDLSIFLHYDSSARKYYTVCDGYSLGYKLLLEKAGIQAYKVSGKQANGGGHSWNLVKLYGNYYHVDVCWDDEENTTKYFMRSDKLFNAPVLNHDVYEWYAVDNPNLRKGTNVAVYDMYNVLGHVNSTLEAGTRVDEKTVRRLQAILGGSNPTDFECVAGDLDFNGVLDARDLTLLKQYINTYSKSYSSVFAWRIKAYS